jgi:hypothetical protein
MSVGNEPAQGLARIGGMLPLDAAAHVATVVAEHLRHTLPLPIPSQPAGMATIRGDIDTWSDAQWAALALWRLQVSSAEADNAGRLESLALAVRALREAGGDEEAAREIAVFAARAYPRFRELIQAHHEGRMPHELVALRRLCRLATLRLDILPREWREARKPAKPFEPAPRKRGAFS